MAERRVWPALVIGGGPDPMLADLVAAALDDYTPAAIEDRAPMPLPPGGVWDPMAPPPDPPSPPLHWRVFFADAATRDRAALCLGQRFPELTQWLEEVPEEDWAARSQREVRAIRAGACIVAPPWDVPAHVPPGETLIIVEPSHGFGTGHHPSTRLCLQALSSLDLAARRVLDLGTGSGVLACAAALRGAQAVTAIDIDADAIAAARATAARNGVIDAVTFVLADYREQAPAPYDVVVANLTGGMLRSSAAAVRARLVPGGRLVMSGFDDQEHPAVREAFAGLPLDAVLHEDGWTALVMRGQSPTGLS